MNIVAGFLKKKLTDYLVSVNENTRNTYMVWGYQNPGGEYCKHTRISNTVYINYPQRTVIGDRVFVGPFTVLDGTGGLVIEEGCQISSWVGIFTHSSHIAIRLYGKHYTEVPEADKKGFLKRHITIGRYSFIGNGVRIFPGGSVGKGAFVNTNAIVKKAIPDFAMVDANGEQTGDTRDLDKRYLMDPQIRAWYEEWQRAER